MRSRSLLVGLAFLGVAFASVSVMAQELGLPIAGTASPMEQGKVVLSAGLIKADESDLFGARVGYALKTGWSVFLDGGVQDAEDDVDPVVQIGTQYSLPLEGSVGFAIRAAAYMPFISDYDYLFGVNLGILGSAPIEAVKGLSVYGGIGVLHERWDYGSTWVKETYHYDIYGNLISVDREKGGDRTEAAISAGLIYQISEQASIYFEFADIADTFLGGGFRFDL